MRRGVPASASRAAASAPSGVWPGARLEGRVQLQLELGGGRHLGDLAGRRGAAGGAAAGAL